jgi:hypothetical protein
MTEFMETGVMPSGVYEMVNFADKTVFFLRVTEEGEFPCETPPGWAREGYTVKTAQA